MKRFRLILSHLGVALSLSLLVLTFLEARNPSMGFLTSGWSAIYIAAQCAICIYFSLTADPKLRRGRRGAAARRERESGADAESGEPRE